MIYHSPWVPYNPIDSLWISVVDSVTDYIVGTDTLTQIWTREQNNFSFRGGYFKEVGGVNLMEHHNFTMIPEAEGFLRCYSDSSLSINFTNKPCDYQYMSIEDATNSLGLTIFPNPASSFIYLKTTSKINLAYKIYNLIGTTIADGHLRNGEEKFSVASLANGFYYIEYRAGAKTFRQKFVVLH